MIEKYENCPDCNKALDQAEYDGQYCRSCGTEPFGFQKSKKRGRGKAPVTRERLEFLITAIGHELARIDALCGERPSLGSEGYSFEAMDAWWKKRDLEIAESKRRLMAEGARFTHRSPDGHAIHLAGIRSSSTSGFTGAFANWRRAARARLERDAA